MIGDVLQILVVAGLVALPGIREAAAARPHPLPETLLVVEPTRENPRNSEGDVVVLANGGLALIYTRFTGGGADNAKADIALRTSSDNGKTWTADRILVPNEGRENTMSVSAIREKGGDILVFYLRKNGWNDCNLFVRRSSDDLATLSAPVRVTVADGYHVVNNARILQMKDGRLVVPAALHTCTDGTRKTWSALGIPRAFLSDDGGRTWRADKTVVEPPPKRTVAWQEPGVTELRDGRLWMYMRTNAGRQYECFSSDRGETWTTPQPTNIFSPCSPATVERIPWTGDLLMVFNDHSGWHVYENDRRTPLCVAISKDDGRTWSPSRVIEPDPNGWYCYTSVTFVGDRALLSYCAGDKQVGGLNRLKVLALPRKWLYPDPLFTTGDVSQPKRKDLPSHLHRYKLADLVLRPTGRPEDFDGHAVECPKVFRWGDRWYMAYTAIAKRDGIIHESIGLCESNDLVHWDHRRQILRQGRPGEFDAGGLSGPFTWVEGKRAYTMYCGFPKAGYESGPGQHGLAWTDDMQTWHKSPNNPVHRVGTKGDWNDDVVYQAFIMKHDGRYWMFYNAHGSKDNCEQIGLAWSNDLITWDEYEGNPILRKGDPQRDRDHVIIADPWIMRLEDKWHMFYFGFDGQHARECVATSDDLLKWTKSPLNPILDVGPPGSYDEVHCHKPCVILHEGVFYHFYTPCGKREDGSEYRAIGLATSKRLPDVAYREPGAF